MSETETLFAALRQSSDEAVVDMLERMVRDAPDHALNKMNALDLARASGIDEERVIATFLNAVGLGMFEMTWSVMCPSCAGVLSANKSLKTLNSAQYNCAFCAAGYETTLDNLVEVTFTVSPRVRKIAAHSPDELSAAEYYRQIFWSSAIDLPDDLEKLLDDVTLEIVDLPAGETPGGGGGLTLVYDAENDELAITEQRGDWLHYAASTLTRIEPAGPEASPTS